MSDDDDDESNTVILPGVTQGHAMPSTSIHNSIVHTHTRDERKTGTPHKSVEA